MDELNPGALRALRRSILLRIHVWATLIATPFALLAIGSGLVYLFSPQIEQARHGHLLQVSQAKRPMLALDQLIAQAESALPQGHWRLQNLRIPQAADESLQIRFKNPHQHGQHHPEHPSAETLSVYLDPYTGKTLGTLDEAERFTPWAADLHAHLLQGDGWRWMIELGASWLLVMLLSGVILWWPARWNRATLSPAGKQGRAAWRAWHGLLGASLAAISAVILLTGLTWSKYGGENVRYLVQKSGQAGKRIPAGLQSASPAAASGARISWQAALEAARRHAPPTALQLSAPGAQKPYWHVRNADANAAQHKFELALDAGDGSRLYYSGWQEMSAFSQATAVGIPFHRGEFGWWNQALLLLFALGLLFSLLSGWVMLWLRWRKTGGSFFNSILPPLPDGAWSALPGWAWLSALLLPLIAPLLLPSALLPAALEYRQAHLAPD
ncbi:PepSY-associated TM helix domain-containing protein [Massilia sp. W12]|uniref:PepSY-associated TM helix domain-containing protein n=1 Tax=Massilia sp. W12 TaxID=3126507 RepID=UPI0030CD991D